VERSNREVKGLPLLSGFLERVSEEVTQSDVKVKSEEMNWDVE
jgi:hypothetical protein